MEISTEFLKTLISSSSNQNKGINEHTSSNPKFHRFINDIYASKKEPTNIKNTNDDDNNISKNSFTNKDNKNYDKHNQKDPLTKNNNCSENCNKDNATADQLTGQSESSNSKPNKPKETKNMKSTKDIKEMDTSKSEAVLQELSKILNVAADKLQDVLNLLGLVQQQLFNQENLVEFVKLSLGSESNMDLLAIDGVKEAMNGIKSLIEETYPKQDLVTSDDNNNNESNLLEQFINSDNLPKTDDVVTTDAIDKKVDTKIDTKVDTKIDTENSGITDNSNIINKIQTELDKNIKHTQNNADDNIQFNEQDQNVTSDDKVISNVKVSQVTENNTENTLNTEEPQVDQATTQPVESNLNQNEANQQNFGNSNSNDNSNQEFKQPLTNELDYENINNIQNYAAKDNVFDQVIQKNEMSKNVDRFEVIKQISEQVKVGIKGELTEVSFTLRPDHLGDVVMKVATQNGIVTAQFVAENQRVKEIIEANFTLLRDMIAEQGIQVQNLEASLANDSNSSNFSFNQNSSNQGGNYSKSNSYSQGEVFSSEKNESYVSQDEVVNSQVNYTI